MKYIDADRLRAEIERRKKEHMYDEMPITIGRYYEDRDLLAFIDSLQQEQPDFPTTDEQIKEFLAAHPKIEVPEKYKNPDWLFKQQEMPEVELEQEVISYFQGMWPDTSIPEGCNATMSFTAPAILRLIKHFTNWQYQKDRREFAKLKAKEWMSGYDDAVSQFVKIPYEPRDWFSSGDGDFICGASFDEAIPAKVELYYRTKSEENESKN